MAIKSEVVARGESDIPSPLTDPHSLMKTADARMIFAELPDSIPPLGVDSVAVLTGAFATLPDSWQSVLWYCDVQGMKPNEAALFLGIAPTLLLMILRRARGGLRAAYPKSELSRTDVTAGHNDRRS